MILDLNGLAGVDEFLQTNLIFFGEKAVLPLFQQPLDLRIHLIQRLDVRCQPLRDTGIAIFVSGILERLQFGARAVRQAFEGIRPMCDDLVALFLAIRPDGQQTVQPVLRGLLIPDKIVLRQAKEGQSFAVSIEGFGGGVFPLLRCIFHALPAPRAPVLRRTHNPPTRQCPQSLRRRRRTIRRGIYPGQKESPSSRRPPYQPPWRTCRKHVDTVPTPFVIFPSASSTGPAAAA